MKRSISFTVLAATAALLASMLVYSTLKQREAEVRKATAQMVQIVVAARDLPLGSKIDPSALKTAPWSRDSLPPGAFTDPSAILNSFVKGAMFENEPVVAGKLFLGEKTAGVMPLLIPAGMRAMSVPVDEVSDIAGFVLPHARVDILVALAINGNEKPFSKVVLQDVEVLAVAQQVEGKKDEPQLVKVVTLLVSPADAERLALASHEGTLRLAMRNYNDNKIVLTSGADVAGLLRAYSLTPPVMRAQPGVSRVAAAAPRPALEVEVMRDGKSRRNVSFINAAAVNEELPQRSTTPRLAEGGMLSARTPYRSTRAGFVARHPTVDRGPEARRDKAPVPSSALAAYARVPKTIVVPDGEDE